MPFGYLILLIAGPLLELALLIKAGQWLGIWPLFGIIIGSGILGVYVLRHTGISVLQRMLSGRLLDDPLPSMVDTSVRFTAGVLLILPGLIGDVIGLLLLVPAVRRLLVPRLWRGTSGASSRWTRFRAARSEDGRFRFRRRPGAPPPPGDAPPSQPTGPGDTSAGHPPPRTRGGGPVIDGEFERIGERTIDPRRPRGPT